MKRFSFVLTSLVILSVMLGFMRVNDSETEVAILRVESSAPDAVIIFEASIGGDAPDDFQKIERQSTPFELTVDSDNFYGLFHRLEGSGEMRVTVTNRSGMIRSVGNISFVQKRGSHFFATQL